MSDQQKFINKLLSNDEQQKKYYFKVVKNYYQFYNQFIKEDQKLAQSLQNYKNSGYQHINQFLNDYVQFEINNLLEVIVKISKKKNIFQIQSEKQILQNINKYIQEIVQQEALNIVQDIINIDNVIIKAPKLQKSIVVYRGTNYDIFNELECIKSDYYFQHKGFVSTSFQLNTALNFAQNQSCLYVIILPKNSYGIPINWMKHDSAFQEEKIDYEYEYILPRNCQFKIQSIQNISYKTFFDRYQYKQIDCLLKHKNYLKTYILKLVQQPNEDQLTQEQKKLLNNRIFNIKSEDLFFKTQ